LTFKPIPLHGLLSVSAKVVIVTSLTVITIYAVFRHAFRSSPHGFGSLCCNALSAAGFRSAVIDIIAPTAGTAITCSDNTRPSFATKRSEVVSVLPSTDMRRTRGARLLASARWLIGGATLLADALAIAVAGLPVRFQSTRLAALCVRRVLNHHLATAWASDGSIRSSSHALHYNGGWRIV
jgi:hypothetical protein